MELQQNRYRKLRRDSLYYVSDSEHSSAGGGLAMSSMSHVPSSCSTLDANDTLKSAVSHDPVPIGVFLQHVDSMRRNNGFEKEFAALETWEMKRMVAMGYDMNNGTCTQKYFLNNTKSL